MATTAIVQLQLVLYFQLQFIAARRISLYFTGSSESASAGTPIYNMSSYFLTLAIGHRRWFIAFLHAGLFIWALCWPMTYCQGRKKMVREYFQRQRALLPLYLKHLQNNSKHYQRLTVGACHSGTDNISLAISSTNHENEWEDGISFGRAKSKLIQQLQPRICIGNMEGVSA